MNSNDGFECVFLSLASIWYLKWIYYLGYKTSIKIHVRTCISTLLSTTKDIHHSEVVTIANCGFDHFVKIVVLVTFFGTSPKLPNPKIFSTAKVNAKVVPVNMA